MLNRPVFKQHFHLEVAEDERVVYLLSESRHYYLKGYLYCLLAGLLDGENRTEDIVEQLEIFYPRQKVEETLLHLEKRGFIVEANPSLSSAESAFWQLQDIDDQEAGKRLVHSTVAVTTLGGVDDRPFVAQLESLGVKTGTDASVRIVLTNDYLQPDLEDINRMQIKSNIPWLLVKPVGGVIWIGPFFVPGESGCWNCLATRLRGNREVESTLLKRRSRPDPFPTSRAALPVTIEVGAALAATQVALSLAEPAKAPLAGIVATIDIATMVSRKHILSKRPQCPVCGVSIEKFPKPVQITSRIKQFTEDGGHRIQSPAETLRQFDHLVSPITGVVSEVKQAFTGGNGLVSIYCGVHEIPGHTALLEHMQASLRNNATGKGKSEVQSKASALSEGVERYCALYRGNGYRVKKSLNQMDEKVVSIEQCLLFSKSQYRNREAWNKEHLLLDYVPARLDPDHSIDWTPVWSLTDQSFVYVPTAHCYLGYYDPVPGGPVYYNHDSNGLAAGNVIEEAILQGFFELIERDCVSIWWYNRLSCPGVDLKNFADPYFEALENYYSSLDREFWVLDLTCDTAIPTFAAISRRKYGGNEEITFGFGTHFDARIGISRALTEMNQALYLLGSGRTSYMAKSDREDFMKKWNRTATTENQPYLAPDSSVSLLTRDAYLSNHNDDIRDDIEKCLTITRELDLEVFVHDLSQPDVGMKVVKVIVPKLRTFRARFAPGRLYDVPVKMGLRETPLTESELNPICWWL